MIGVKALQKHGGRAGWFLGGGRLARVRRAYADPPQPLFRVNGKDAIGVAIVMRDGGDILTLGFKILDLAFETVPLTVETFVLVTNLPVELLCATLKAQRLVVLLLQRLDLLAQADKAIVGVLDLRPPRQNSPTTVAVTITHSEIATSE